MRVRVLLAAALASSIALSWVLTAGQARAEEQARAAESLPGAAAPLTREAALERLRRDNLSLLAARHRLSQSRADVIAAGVWTNPNLSVTALFLTHGVVTGGSKELGASVDQVIPIAGQIGLRKELARGLLGADERAYAANVWDALSDAKLAYVDLQRAQARWRIVRAGTLDLARVETIVTERASAGANAAYDRIRAGVERSKLDGRLAQAEAELVAARVALAQSIGPSIDGRTVTVQDDVDEPSAPPGELDALVRRALANRPDVESARLRANAGDVRVKYLKRMVVPSPDVSVGYMRYFDVPGSGSGGAVIAGVSLPIPVLDRGQGSIDRGLAVAAEDRTRKDVMELTVRREIERAASTLALRVATWQRFRDTTSLEIDRLRAIGELSYREGRMSILELLDAYGAYVEARERRIELQTEAVKAALDLERAIGPR